MFSEMDCWLAGWLVYKKVCETESAVLSECDSGRSGAVSFDAREFGSDQIPLSKADKAELKLTKMLYLYPNRRLKAPVDDRSFVGVAALRMTAVTVLRMVLLRKAIDVAQSSACVVVVFTVYLNLSQKLESHAKHIDILICVSQHHCSHVGRLLY